MKAERSRLLGSLAKLKKGHAEGGQRAAAAGHRAPAPRRGAEAAEAQRAEAGATCPLLLLLLLTSPPTAPTITHDH